VANTNKHSITKNKTQQKTNQTNTNSYTHTHTIIKTTKAHIGFCLCLETEHQIKHITHVNRDTQTTANKN